MIQEWKENAEEIDVNSQSFSSKDLKQTIPYGIVFPICECQDKDVINVSHIVDHHPYMIKCSEARIVNENTYTHIPCISIVYNIIENPILNSVQSLLWKQKPIEEDKSYCITPIQINKLDNPIEEEIKQIILDFEPEILIFENNIVKDYPVLSNDIPNSLFDIDYGIDIQESIIIDLLEKEDFLSKPFNNKDRDNLFKKYKDNLKEININKRIFVDIINNLKRSKLI